MIQFSGARRLTRLISDHVMQRSQALAVALEQTAKRDNRRLIIAVQPDRQTPQVVSARLLLQGTSLLNDEFGSLEVPHGGRVSHWLADAKARSPVGKTQRK